MIQHSLLLDQVILPRHPPDWPIPLNLTLGLKEFLIIEGLTPAGAQKLLSLAATLQFPTQGRVRYWGQEPAQGSRPELYRLRRRIAYISPGQVLLGRLTVVENITLPARYFQQRTMKEIVRDYSDLIERLELTPYFSCYPAELPADIYSRVLWACALIKKPELILAAPFSSPITLKNNHLILSLLRDYREQHRGAVLLAGPDLQAARPLADRLLRLQAGRLTEIRVPGHAAPPVTPYLSFL